MTTSDAATDTRGQAAESTPKKPLTAPAIKALKGLKKVSVITAYDYPSAKLADEAGFDVVLVGDSLAMVVLGRPDTLSVTLDEMIHHCRAAATGTTTALLVGDMPFGTYEGGVEAAVTNAARMVREGGVRAVKLEGARHMPALKAILAAGIPVMGHIGLTPQRAAELGGFTVQGKSEADAERLLAEAALLAQAGCFSLVLECLPADLARRITEAVPIPTIGIGAGPYCDGQVLVWHDVLGLFDRFKPKFVKRYAELNPSIREALALFRSEIEANAFPDAVHSFGAVKREDGA